MDELRREVSRLVEARSDIELSISGEFLTLIVEGATKPCRYLRINAIDGGEYMWRWSSYRATNEDDNGDGVSMGNLQRALDAVRHWIVEGMRWQDVREFQRP